MNHEMVLKQPTTIMKSGFLDLSPISDGEMSICDEGNSSEVVKVNKIMNLKLNIVNLEYKFNFQNINRIFQIQQLTFRFRVKKLKRN